MSKDNYETSLEDARSKAVRLSRPRAPAMLRVTGDDTGYVSLIPWRRITRIAGCGEGSVVYADGDYHYVRESIDEIEAQL